MRPPEFGDSDHYSLDTVVGWLEALINEEEDHIQTWTGASASRAARLECAESALDLLYTVADWTPAACRAYLARTGQKAVQATAKKAKTPFKAGTGMLGATASGQRVTADNVSHLPPGSVVRLDFGGRLIHLHDEVWLYCSDHVHCYDRIENLKHRLPGELCHLPPGPETKKGSKKVQPGSLPFP